jgi:hypothetical protein
MSSVARVEYTAVSRAIERQINSCEQKGDVIGAAIYKDCLLELEVHQTIRKLVCTMGFRRIPPGWDEFLNSSEFLDGEMSMYNLWYDTLQEIFYHPLVLPKNRSKNVLILNNSGIGTGKTHVGQLVMLYTLVALACIEDKGVVFPHLGPKKPLWLTLHSAFRATTKNDIYEPLRAYFLDMKYVRKNVKVNPDYKNQIIMENNVCLAFLTGDTTSIIGKDIIATLVDELAFMRQTSESSQTSDGQGLDHGERLAKGILQRHASRFEADLPVGFTLALMMSSVNHPHDSMVKMMESDYEKHVLRYTRDMVSPELFCKPDYTRPTVEEVTQVIKDAGEDPMDYTLRLASSKYKKEPPKVVAVPTFTWDVATESVLPGDHGADNIQVFKIPTIYKHRFVADPILTAREYLNVQPKSINSFMPTEQEIAACVRSKPSLGDKIFNKAAYMSSDNIVISPERVREWLGSVSMHPTALKFFIHFDYSTVTDTTAMSCAHLVDIVTVDAMDKRIKFPKVVVDWVLPIIPVQSHPINGEKIYGIIADLVRFGVPIESITYDQYQATQFTTLFSRLGIHNYQLSVDRTTTPYDDLRRLIYNRLVDLPKNEVLLTELAGLRVHTHKNGEKVDHPKGGSKDISDAVCGAVFGVKDYCYRKRKLV